MRSWIKIFGICAVLISNFAAAEPYQAQTIAEKIQNFAKSDGSSEFDHGFKVSPGLEFTTIAGQNLEMNQMSLAYIFDHSLSLGIISSVSQTRKSETSAETAGFNYTGGFVNWSPLSEQVAHPLFGMTYADGRYTRTDYNEYPGPTNIPYFTSIEQKFTIYQPEIAVELNLFKYLRMSTGVAYRFTSKFDNENFARNEVNNYSYISKLSLGYF